MTPFESASLAIAAGQLLTGAAGVLLIWVGVRQMVRANDARAKRDGVLLESLSRANEALGRANESLGLTNESLGLANEALAELLRDRRQAGKSDAP